MKNFIIDTPLEKSSMPMQPHWKGADAIQLAYQLNERCIELLSELAASAPLAEDLPPFVQKNRDLWSNLNADARRRLATFPFVIVDVRFGDEHWWRALGASSPTIDTVDSLPRDRCEYLSLETLMFAWQVAREDSRIAQMLFAMTHPVARIIGALAMREIRTLAADQASCLRVRWSRDVLFWRELLERARGEDPAALEESRLHAKLLFCGDLVGRLHGAE